MNEYLTSRLTFNIKLILENRLTYGKNMNHIESIIKLNVDTFYRIYKFEYKALNVPEDLGNEDNDRVYDIFDVVFKDKKNIFHHFVIRGMDRDRAILKKDNPIFYPSSEDGDDDLEIEDITESDESHENSNEY